MRGRALLPLFLFLAFTLSAAAQEKPKAKPQPAQPQADNPYVARFQELDRNKDAYVTLDEWPLEPEKLKLVDRDKDGKLSQHELTTPNVLQRERRDRFGELDIDRDGRLNREERRRGGTGLDGLDGNRDGYITRREYVENTFDARATYRDQRRFEALDRDRDNRLTRQEWTGAGGRFDQLDVNRDGVISPNEWPR
jgi:Ca2+-binding EF-hand superfamily protein